MSYFLIDKDKYPVYGIDTSHYTMLVDWEKYKETGASFAILKMLDGKTVDPQFQKNYKAAKDAGVLVSVYQWLYGSGKYTSPAGQAREYAKMLRDYPVDFLPTVDYEWCNPSPNRSDLYSYMEAFFLESNYYPMIYSAPGYLGDPSYRLDSTYFGGGKFKLWIAHYEVSRPTVPSPFTKWDFWQVSERADGLSFGSPVDGEKEIDINYFNGTKNDFLAFCGIITEDYPVEPEDETPVEVKEKKYYSPNVNSLNVRPEPSMNKPALMKIGTTDIVTGTGNITADGLWTQIMTLGGVIGWCYSTYLSLVKVVETEEETPPPPIETPANSDEQILFNNAVRYKKVTVSSPRNVTYHVMEIRTSRAKIVFDTKVSVASTTHFLEYSGSDIAVNGDGFYPVKQGRGYVTQMAGMNAGNGIVYGNRPAEEQTLFISKDNVFSLDRQNPIWNAMSFPNLLVKDGNVVSISKAKDDIRARTAVGYTKDQTKFFLVTVDGGDYYSKQGMNFQETAEVMKALGCDVAVMLDGGGSTTMVIRENGKAKIVNKPSGENHDGQRSVANHFGVKIIA